MHDFLYTQLLNLLVLHTFIMQSFEQILVFFLMLAFPFHTFKTCIRIMRLYWGQYPAILLLR